MHHIVWTSSHMSTRGSHDLLYWVIRYHLLFIMDTWLSLSLRFLLLLSGWSIHMLLMNDYIRVYIGPRKDWTRKGLDVSIDSAIYSMSSHHCVARVSELLHVIVVHIAWVVRMSVVNWVLRGYLLLVIMMTIALCVLLWVFIGPHLLIHDYKSLWIISLLLTLRFSSFMVNSKGLLIASERSNHLNIAFVIIILKHLLLLTSSTLAVILL